MKKVLMLMTVFACTLLMHAQEKAKFSVIAGTNLSTFTGDVENVAQVLRFSFGVGLNCEVSEEWAVRPSLRLVTKGGEIKGILKDYLATGIDVRYTETARPLYLELPVDFCYRVPLSKNVKFNVLAGAYLSYGLSGEIELEQEVGGSTVPEKEDFFGSSKARHLDAGLGLGVGLEVSKLIFSLKAQFGLVNMSRAGVSLKNQTLGFNVAYTF